MKVARIEEYYATLTNGGSTTAGEYYKRPLNTIKNNDGIEGLAVANGIVSMPEGKFYVYASTPFYGTQRSRSFISLTGTYTGTEGINLWTGPTEYSGSTSCRIEQGVFINSDVPFSFSLWQWFMTAVANTGKGMTSNIHAWVDIMQIK